jgi:hypothetical protein
VAITLFRDTTYSVSLLIESIGRGEVALPDIQRPFVWQASKVRDLLDSKYKGFPVGYLLFWETGAEPGARQIGGRSKEVLRTEPGSGCGSGPTRRARVGG